jgi:hypothetical protein
VLYLAIHIDPTYDIYKIEKMINILMTYIPDINIEKEYNKIYKLLELQGLDIINKII